MRARKFLLKWNWSHASRGHSRENKKELTSAKIHCTQLSAVSNPQDVKTYIQSFNLLVLFCDCTAWFVTDLVMNPNCWFSHAQVLFMCSDLNLQIFKKLN